MTRIARGRSVCLSSSEVRRRLHPASAGNSCGVAPPAIGPSPAHVTLTFTLAHRVHKSGRGGRARPLRCTLTTPPRFKGRLSTGQIGTGNNGIENAVLVLASLPRGPQPLPSSAPIEIRNAQERLSERKTPAVRSDVIAWHRGALTLTSHTQSRRTARAISTPAPRVNSGSPATGVWFLPPVRNQPRRFLDRHRYSP
jgi:hypothetical protein